MKYLWMPGFTMLLIALPALASEATFDRTLSITGPVDLTVSNGTGNIHLTRGPDNQVHIFGRIRSEWGAREERIREIAANPPIEQTGNIIRVGTQHMDLHNINIDLEIQAPAGTHLDAGTGSGNISDDGVGKNAKLSTGSGDIHAEGLQGGFTVETGSGSLVAEQTGEGDVKAETGSGNIQLRGLHGGLRAGTGSGDIRVSGSPTTAWRLQTGSGSIDFTPGNTGWILDASTGSGSVHSEREMVTQGAVNRHHVTGKFNGGGPIVRMETGSGNIRIH